MERVRLLNLLGLDMKKKKMYLSETSVVLYQSVRRNI
jgi:hypothetical protein